MFSLICCLGEFSPHKLICWEFNFVAQIWAFVCECVRSWQQWKFKTFQAQNHAKLPKAAKNIFAKKVKFKLSQKRANHDQRASHFAHHGLPSNVTLSSDSTELRMKNGSKKWYFAKSNQK